MNSIYLDWLINRKNRQKSNKGILYFTIRKIEILSKLSLVEIICGDIHFCHYGMK